MPECRDCGAFIRSGARCQMHALEHRHGTLEDRRDERDEWCVKQAGLDGEPARGQLDLAGHVVKNGSDER